MFRILWNLRAPFNVSLNNDHPNTWIVFAPTLSTLAMSRKMWSFGSFFGHLFSASTCKVQWIVALRVSFQYRSFKDGTALACHLVTAFWNSQCTWDIENLWSSIENSNLVLSLTISPSMPDFEHGFISDALPYTAPRCFNATPSLPLWSSLIRNPSM